MKLGTLPIAKKVTPPTERQTLEACARATEKAAHDAQTAGDSSEAEGMITRAIIFARKAKRARSLFNDYETLSASLEKGDTSARDAFEKVAAKLAAQITRLLPAISAEQALNLAKTYGPFDTERRAVDQAAEQNRRDDQRKIATVRELKALAEEMAIRRYGSNFTTAWAQFMQDGGL